MKFNRLCFLSVIFICTMGVFSQSVFAGGFVSARSFLVCVQVSLQKQGGTGGPDNFYISSSKISSKVYTSKVQCSDNNNNITSITIPTRAGYVFKGYYSSQAGGDLFVTSDGKITDKLTSAPASLTTIYAQWEKCETSVENNVCKVDTNCPTGLKYGENEDCVPAEKYLDNGEWKTCPEPKQGYTTRYSFTKEEDSSYDIETCAIKLTKTSCGSRTKIIYKYSIVQNAYVRSDDYVVLAGNKSLLKSTYPSDIIYLDGDTNDAHNSQTEDYCDACDTGQYNVKDNNGNDMCGYCHSGYCVDTATDSCEICPAGFACPGDGDRASNETLYCSAKTACGPDEYAESGRSQCSKCGMGFSTFASGPAVRISEDVVFDGTCGSRDGDDASAFGIMCTSIDACKSIPVQLCFNPQCQCTKEESSDAGNYIEQRTSCGSSYGLGDNKVWGAINTKVVQTQRKDRS